MQNAMVNWPNSPGMQSYDASGSLSNKPAIRRHGTKSYQVIAICVLFKIANDVLALIKSSLDDQLFCVNETVS